MAVLGLSATAVVQRLTRDYFPTWPQIVDDGSVTPVGFGVAMGVGALLGVSFPTRS